LSRFLMVLISLTPTYYDKILVIRN
jgi:hypothetical protein